jgi:thiosulfate reductase/polysulfide reductase chain A
MSSHKRPEVTSDEADAKAPTTLSRRELLTMAAAAGGWTLAGGLGCSIFTPARRGKALEEITSAPSQPTIPPLPGDVIDYRTATAIPTICFGCTTHCGVIGWVQDERVRRISGNPLDPNSQGKICAKANGMIAYTYYPERLLYPLKRVGKRGEGRWKRISWDAALEEIASKMRPLREAGRPDRFVFHYGRDKTKGYTKRFTNAFGTPHRLNRRSICSSNRRAPLMSFYGREFEWESQDIANTRYILNFGGNPCEAYQGGLFILNRLQTARVDHGAKLITFEVRPSATASISDEYHPIFPGTDGAVAMAMCHVIVDEERYDKAFIDRWTNVSVEELAPTLKRFTPEFAEQVSGIKADVIRRLAREFADAAPHCCTLSNRGSAKHYNGYQSDRAIRLLDVLVGNVGKPGGFCLSSLRGWAGRYGQEGLPKLSQPGPKPSGPKAWAPGHPAFEELPAEIKERVSGFPEMWKKKYFGELATPSEYPLSWHWYSMRVGQLVYEYIRESRQKVDVYMSYTLGAAYGYPEARAAREVLASEELIPFHVAIDIGYSEQAALADIILPDATSLERWDAHSTNNYGLIPYTGIRQPLVEPLGEARSVQVILRDLARRIGGGMETYFDFDDMEDFYKGWYSNLPMDWETFKARGIWYDETREPDYELYERPLTDEELVDSEVEAETGRIFKRTGPKRRCIGLRMPDGKAVRGFPTPSRLIEVRDDVFAIAARAVGIDESDPLADPLPTWFPIPGHEQIPTDRFVFTTFKWNVHAQGRTGHLKYQAEIVHSNPLWINPETAKELGLQEGDEVEVTVYRPQGKTYKANEKEPVGSFINRVKIVHGMHPRVVASSHHTGHWEHGPIGGERDRIAESGGPGAGMDPALADPDIAKRMWWSKARGGVGRGVHINDAMPINPAPLVGGQNWYDNICSIKRT